MKINKIEVSWGKSQVLTLPKETIHAKLSCTFEGTNTFQITLKGSKSLKDGNISNYQNHKKKKKKKMEADGRTYQPILSYPRYFDVKRAHCDLTTMKWRPHTPYHWDFNGVLNSKQENIDHILDGHLVHIRLTNLLVCIFNENENKGSYWSSRYITYHWVFTKSKTCTLPNNGQHNYWPMLYLCKTVNILE